MAEIRIIGNIERVTNVSRFKEEDLRIISSKNEINSFGTSDDYIEYFVYDAGGSLLNLSYNYTDFKSSPNVGLNIDGTIKYIEIDPVKDLQDLGYSTGEFAPQYNFLRKKISDNIQEGLFIKEISPDRTELRVASTVLINEQIETATLKLIDEINSATYFKTYLANFGLNQQAVIVNVALNKQNVDTYEILLKLYEPLPESFETKSPFWLVDEIIEPYIFNINLDRLVIPDALPVLRGPNFDIELIDKNTVTTQYQNYTELLQNQTGSTYQQFLSFVTSQSIDINVDYSNFNNFVKFSSAKKRVENFYTKVQTIQSYQSQINTYLPLTSATSSLIAEIGRLSASINDTIAHFDGFEYYLYFESGSTLTSSIDYSITPYPKSGSLKPYTLFLASSDSASFWYDYALSQSIEYDRVNQDNLENTIPLYIREDDNNTNYFVFINMVGHYFDNIWIYLKSVTDLYKSYNNLEDGVSRDLAYYALRSLGFKTYNSKESAELLDYIVGTNSGSISFDNNFTSTGSYLNNIPRQDLVAESFKRIYHNISLLFKSKGSYQGLNYLSNIFGITSSILDVKEFGGTTKSNYLKGYTPDKIRVSTYTITGSVLSPFIGLEQKPTASSEIINIDYHRVETAFSPQNQINTAISSSIASTFSIDNIIGDPNYAYSSSYIALQATASAAFATAFDYAFDYAGFIRLIKFFDNTLFKTFKDFTPARANLSTGVIIRSPQVERNKVKQVKPNFETSSVQEATYSIAGISEDNSYLYPYLEGSKAAFYTGELPTTMSSVNYYFEYTNPNPYLLSTATVTLPTITGSATYSFNDSNIFEHTDFNVLLNNVTGSRLSTIRKQLEPIYAFAIDGLRLSGYSSSYYAELQDSYLSLKTYRLARYEGIKTTSLLYNTYTSASNSYIGDISFGKTAAIDKQVKKIGLFAQITENRYLPYRNNIALKYLVNQEGELTELNQRNKHWEEVQRTFISGDILDISLFDNQKYGNQKLTDGTKPIFDSGYSYYPILYFAGCSSDPIIYFENLAGSSAYLASAINSLSPYSISGSTSIQYPLSGGYVKNIFDKPIPSVSYFNPGTTGSFPSYLVQETGNYKVQATFNFAINFPVNNSAVWALQVYKSGSSGETLLFEDAQTYVSSSSGGGGGGGGSICPGNYIYYVTNNEAFNVFIKYYTTCGNPSGFVTVELQPGELLKIDNTTVRAYDGRIYRCATLDSINVASPTGANITIDYQGECWGELA